MTDLYLIKNEVPAKTIPCMVLGSLQADLATIMKLKTMPYERTYILSEDSYVEISIQKLESGLFQLQIKSPDRSDTLTDPKSKKLVDMTHMLVWLALSTSLSRTSLPPCASTAHSGAHEILALYGCLEALKGT